METKAIYQQKSQINWTGKKINGKYTGEMQFKDGHLKFDGSELTGGAFTVDMTSLKVDDLEGEEKDKFEGHLKSDDFFNVEKFPTSKLVFKQIAEKQNGYGIAADLTIKGITKLVTFDLIIDQSTAQAEIVIDRTQFDIKFNSGNFFDNLGEMLIYDDFRLNVKLSY